MEHNGGNDLTSGSMCRAGCGFYANAAFEGMCSKCFKDALKRRQQNSSPSGRISPAFTTSSTNTPSSGAERVTMVTTPSLKLTPPSIETATPTVTMASGGDKDKAPKEQAEAATGGAEASVASSSDSPTDKDKKPKKNRCHSCKKKVGLTGFECRCGGLYCSMHRYSDKHECTFNYKELAQQQIRKANPVCVGQKIQKI